MLYQTTFRFHANRSFFVEEVNRNSHFNQGIGIYAQEIGVHHGIFGRVTLQVLENGLLRILAHIDS